MYNCLRPSEHSPSILTLYTVVDRNDVYAAARRTSYCKDSSEVRLGGDHELEDRMGNARVDYKFNQDCPMGEVPLTEDENCVGLMVNLL
jgi:hypothetical protein